MTYLPGRATIRSAVTLMSTQPSAWMLLHRTLLSTLLVTLPLPNVDDDTHDAASTVALPTLECVTRAPLSTPKNALIWSLSSLSTVNMSVFFWNSCQGDV